MSAINRDELVESTVDNLSRLILRDARSCASEQRHPGMDADKSDDSLKEDKERIKVLRELREQFENAMTGVLL